MQPERLCVYERYLFKNCWQIFVPNNFSAGFGNLPSFQFWPQTRQSFPAWLGSPGRSSSRCAVPVSSTTCAAGSATAPAANTSSILGPYKEINPCQPCTIHSISKEEITYAGTEMGLLELEPNAHARMRAVCLYTHRSVQFSSAYGEPGWPLFCTQDSVLSQFAVLTPHCFSFSLSAPSPLANGLASVAVMIFPGVSLSFFLLLFLMPLFKLLAFGRVFLFHLQHPQTPFFSLFALIS